MSDNMDVVATVEQQQPEAPAPPNWVVMIGRAHEGFVGALGHVASLFSRGVTPEISLSPLDERFRTFHKKETITDIENDSYDKDLIFIDYKSSEDLTNTLRQSSLRSDIVTTLQNSRCVDILFHHRNSDTRYNYLYEMSIVKFKYNYSFYYAMIHKSKYHVPSQFKLNILLTDSFIALYESVYIYLTDTYAVTPYAELNRCINKEFIFHLYQDYVARSNEITHINPYISHLRVPAIIQPTDAKPIGNDEQQGSKRKK